MGIEYELKFRAEDAALTAIYQAYCQYPHTQYDMETTYYDTPSGALSARHYTLRRRMENDRSVCTLKAPIKGVGKGEWETECDRIEDAIAELCKLGAPKKLMELTKNGVIAVCGAKFQRIAKTIHTGDCTVELALDKGILFGGGKEIPLCVVEVELKDGEPAACAAFARILAAKFGLVTERRSKVARAMALCEGA